LKKRYRKDGEYFMSYVQSTFVYLGVREKNPRKKIDLLERAFALGAREWIIFQELGKAYAAIGKVERAEEYLLQALSCDVKEETRRKIQGELKELEKNAMGQ